jgi:hypothetical protein
MALKGDRTETVQDIKYFMNEVAERGGIALMSTASSGVGLDSSTQLATYTYASGAYALGILMQDMVNVDQTKYHINQYKDEAQMGSKVRILRQGWVVTDMVYPGHTPTAGGIGYVGHSGYIAASDVNPDAANLAVGRFETTKDEDGYVNFYVNLPNIG